MEGREKFGAYGAWARVWGTSVGFDLFSRTSSLIGAVRRTGWGRRVPAPLLRRWTSRRELPDIPRRDYRRARDRGE